MHAPLEKQRTNLLAADKDLATFSGNMDSINCRANGNSTEEILGHATVQYVYAAFLVVSCLLCFVGNTLNFVVLRKLTDISEPRKVVFYFLSMSDLCTGISWVPSIPAVVLKSWPFGRGFCVFCIYLIITNLGISIILILLVTYDCFIAVVYPYKYASIITKSRAISISFFVTVSYYAVMAVFIGVGSTGPFSDVQFYPMIGSCFVNYAARGPLTYSTYGFSYFLILFAIIMIIMQGMVANISRKQARRIAESEGRFRDSALTEDFKTEAATSGIIQERKGAKDERQRMPGRRQPSELKGVLVCIAVSAAFFVAWLPMAVWQIYTVHIGGCVNSVAALSTVVFLSTSQCWINPFIYMVMKRNYRQRLYKILDPIFKRCRIQS